MDITDFMQWFISQVINIFTWAFNLLDSIHFFGTSLLKVLIVLSILFPLIMTLITVSNNASVRYAREKVGGKKK